MKVSNDPMISVELFLQNRESEGKAQTKLFENRAPIIVEVKNYIFRKISHLVKSCSMTVRIENEH